MFCREGTYYFLMLWDSEGGWVLCLNREYNYTLKLLDPELLNPKP